MKVARRTAAVLICLTLSLGIEARTLRLGAPWDRHAGRVLAAYALAGVVFVVAVLALRKIPARRASVLILTGAAAFQAIAVCFVPTTTDDFYRYVWDGTVQAHGIDPYRYTPLDPALRDLRDPWLFPTGPVAQQLVAASPARGYVDACTYLGVAHDCTRINRPTVHTIYPPVAEAAFLGLHLVSPQHERRQAAQVFSALLAWATALVLIGTLRRSGRPVWPAAWWAWCPMVWLECGNNAHIDVLGILLLVGTFAVLSGRRAQGAGRLAVAGALFGAAVAVKLIPVLVAPALATRRRAALLATAAAVFLAGYLPHVVAVGTDVIGYLPGYLHEEGYSGAQRFGALRLLVPGPVAAPVGAVVLAAVAVAVLRRADRNPPALGAVALVGITFVIVGPSQPWYALLLVGLAVLAERPEWLAVAAAAYPVYFSGALRVSNTAMQQCAYLSAAAVVVLVQLTRRRKTSYGLGERPRTVMRCGR
jgi:hypothetical protein